MEEAVNFSVITLRNTETKYEAEIYSFGALLNAFRFPFKNSVINIVDGFSSPEEAKQKIAPFFRSAKLSPFVCRMKEGRYALGNTTYQVEKYYLGKHAIHGLLYDAVYETRQSITDQEGAAIVLHHHYDGSDNGYPFEFDVEIEWRLSEGNVLSCKTSISHSNDLPIPYADGWHPYFSLDTSIDECYLEFDGTHMVEFDGELIPTGNILAEDKFRSKQYVRGMKLDNCFVLDQSLAQPRIVFSSEQLRLTVMPEPSYPYLQLYTPDDRKSIAIENLSGIPDCFNNNIGLRMISPNEQASFTTHYHAGIIT